MPLLYHKPGQFVHELLSFLNELLVSKEKNIYKRYLKYNILKGEGSRNDWSIHLEEASHARIEAILGTFGLLLPLLPLVQLPELLVRHVKHQIHPKKGEGISPTIEREFAGSTSPIQGQMD